MRFFNGLHQTKALKMFRAKTILVAHEDYTCDPRGLYLCPTKTMHVPHPNRSDASPEPFGRGDVALPVM